MIIKNCWFCVWSKTVEKILDSALQGYINNFILVLTSESRDFHVITKFKKLAISRLQFIIHSPGKIQLRRTFNFQQMLHNYFASMPYQYIRNLSFLNLTELYSNEIVTEVQALVFFWMPLLHSSNIDITTNTLSLQFQISKPNIWFFSWKRMLKPAIIWKCLIFIENNWTIFLKNTWTKIYFYKNFSKKWKTTEHMPVNTILPKVWVCLNVKDSTVCRAKY